MPNPNGFEFQIQGKTQFADPLKVRRLLLQNTMGKCWGIFREINKTKKIVQDARDRIVALEKDLETTPTTPEEMAKIQEDQKIRAEGGTPTRPFTDFPREYQLSGFEGQVAIYSNKISELEGVLARASMMAFELPEYDLNTGEGVTEQEAIELLKLFVEYAEGKGERLGS